jgi:hypothetical protein
MAKSKNPKIPFRFPRKSPVLLKKKKDCILHKSTSKAGMHTDTPPHFPNNF